jgi:lysozyme
VKASETCIAFIKQFEGLRLDAYQCSAGVWTIGYGHTGKGVVPGVRIDEAEAEALLRYDVEKFERGVAELVTVPLSQNQFDALVCFAFNLGLGALRSSTLLRKLNDMDKLGAAEEFLRWVYAGGKKLKGLETRRQAERALFLAGLGAV